MTGQLAVSLLLSYCRQSEPSRNGLHRSGLGGLGHRPGCVDRGSEPDEPAGAIMITGSLLTGGISLLLRVINRPCGRG